MPGLLDLLRPRDPQGNVLPIATVEVNASNKTMQNFALILLAAIAINKMIPNPKTRK